MSSSDAAAMALIGAFIGALAYRLLSWMLSEGKRINLQNRKIEVIQAYYGLTPQQAQQAYQIGLLLEEQGQALSSASLFGARRLPEGQLIFSSLLSADQPLVVQTGSPDGTPRSSTPPGPTLDSSSGPSQHGPR